MTRLWIFRFLSLIGLVISGISWILLFRGFSPSEFGGEGGSFLPILILTILGVVSLAFLALAATLFLPPMVQRTWRFIDYLLELSPIPAVLFGIFLVLFILGAIFYLSASPTLFGPVYPAWMIPFFAWLISISLIGLVLISLIRSENRVKSLIVLSLFLLVLIFGIVVNLQFWNYGSPRKEDIYYVFLNGQSLLNGINPYESILSGDMLVNQKYSTYLPVMYLFSWVTQAAGLTTFGAWLSLWRVIFLLFNLSIASLLFYIPVKKNFVILSLVFSLFWLFNRWTLHVGKTADIDFVAVFFLLLSLYCFRRQRLLSYLFLGFSLGIKHIGIIVLPLFVIWVWKESHNQPWEKIGKAVFWMASIPALISLPFLIWNWQGFIRSILFSATRLAMASFDVYSIDAYIGLKGIAARLPMGAMLLLIYWVVWKRDLGLYLPVLLVMAVFVFFNPVMFTSYMVWVVPLIPLAVSDYLCQSDSEKSIQL